VALTADLAPPERRGKAVGTVMAGLLIGILLARTLSGVVADVAGWRAVFVLASLTMVGLTVACRRGLQPVPPTSDVSYRVLLASIVTLYREEPVLRRRGFYGALGFAGFATLWTSLAFLLDDAYGYGEAKVGLFGLLGAAGAGAAQLAGRVADTGWARVSTAVFFVIVLVSWAILAAGEHSLAWLIAGVVLLDLAAQGAHISNQSEVYRLRPEARSRITTAYMSVTFTGGVVGSASSAALYSWGGWSAVCWSGAVFSTLALALWLTEARWPLRRMRHPTSTTPSVPSTPPARAGEDGRGDQDRQVWRAVRCGSRRRGGGP
jgi:predicted MFS family arabinose efflux permease